MAIFSSYSFKRDRSVFKLRRIKRGYKFVQVWWSSPEDSKMKFNPSKKEGGAGYLFG